MAKKTEPFVLVHHRDVDDPKDSMGLVKDLTDSGWHSGPPIEGPSRMPGSPGVLLITFRPDRSAFETTS